MSKLQSKPFDPNKHTPELTPDEAKKWVLAMETGSLVHAYQETPEEKAERENFWRNEAEIKERHVREDREAAEAKARREEEKRAKDAAGMKVFQENLAAGREKQRLAELAAREKKLANLNDCVAEIFRGITKLNSGLKEFSLEEIESLPMLRVGLETLLKKL